MTETSQITEIIDPMLLDAEAQMTLVIEDGLSGTSEEQQIKLENPFAFDMSRFHPSESVPTLERFLELTDQIILNAQQREEVQTIVQFTEDYPLERFDRFGDEVVAWRIISRTPANMSTDGRGRPQRGFRYSYHLRSPKYPDKVITVEVRPVDHIVEFSCWAKVARLANRRALWLERLLVNSTWAYQVHGFDRFQWRERLADTFYNVGGQTIYQRPLRFFVRLAEFRPKADPIINQMEFQAGLI